MRQYTTHVLWLIILQGMTAPLFAMPVLTKQPVTVATQANDSVAKTGKDSLSALPSSTHNNRFTALTYQVKLCATDTNKKINLPKNILHDFNEKSLLLSLKKHPLYSQFALNRRIEDDKETLRKILFFYGYYDAIITTDIVKKSTKSAELTVTLSVVLGDRYTLKNLHTDFSENLVDLPSCRHALKEFDRLLGKPYTVDDIQNTFTGIKTQLATCGYPFAKIHSHKAVLDRTTKTISVTLTIMQGPFVRFGLPIVEGARSVPKHYIENRSPLKKGATYNQNEIDDYQDKLSRTRLFKSIQFRHEKKEDDIKNGELVNQRLIVTEGPPRTITAGIKYGTGEGAGLNTSWLHRNLSGRADRFKIETELGQKDREVKLSYDLPDVFKVDQTLKLNTNYTVEKRDAYRANGFALSSVLHNTRDKGWYYFYGLFFENTHITDHNINRRLGTVGVLLGFGRTTIKDPLNPTQGYRFDISLTPELSNIGSQQTITKALCYGAYHKPLDTHNQVILSFWSRLGMIFGSEAQKLPANRRFFGGGSGSVRGYSRDFLSPLDADGKPTGGKSLVAMGIEPRFRINQDWGAVMFLEGGVIGSQTYPRFHKNILTSGGFGLRYHTDFGPIRADIAFPFKRRKDSLGKPVDSAFQFYISIGQAF